MLNNCQINNYQITGQIGSGAYGVVFHAIDLITENEYAIKAIMKSTSGINSAGSSTNPGSKLKKSAVLQTQLYHYFKSFQNKLFLPAIDLDSVMTLTEDHLTQAPHYREILLHLKCHSHENVVTIYQILESSLATFIVMDYYPTDLFTSIVEKQHFSNDGLMIKKAFLQLCSVLQHCHSLGVYHCDIKPENILLDAHDNIKLCDFGLATTESYINANVCVGSSYYMAPERVSCPSSILHPNGIKNFIGRNLFPTNSGDIWSLGIILINLTCIRNPWLKAHQTHDSTFKYFINDSRVLKKILPLSEELFLILDTVLQLDPTKRTDLNSLMEAVGKCCHFTNSGPLANVEPLSDQQFNSFISGDDAVNIKNMLYRYNDATDWEDEESSESSYDLKKYHNDIEKDQHSLYSIGEYDDDITDKNSHPQMYSVDTTPNMSCTIDADAKPWLKMKFSEFNLSTMTNESQHNPPNANINRWTPN